jgi:hypothetical protein
MADDTPHERRRVRFDPTINLGHILTAAVFLITATMGFAVLQYKVDRQADEIARVERQGIERVERAERQWSTDQQRDREAFVEIKVLLREISQKLDTKQDKPR